MRLCGEWGPDGPTRSQQIIIETTWTKAEATSALFTELMNDWFKTNISGRYWFIDYYRTVCFEYEFDAILYRLTWK